MSQQNRIQVRSLLWKVIRHVMPLALSLALVVGTLMWVQQGVTVAHDDIDGDNFTADEIEEPPVDLTKGPDEIEEPPLDLAKNPNSLEEPPADLTEDPDSLEEPPADLTEEPDDSQQPPGDVTEDPCLDSGVSLVKFAEPGPCDEAAEADEAVHFEEPPAAQDEICLDYASEAGLVKFAEPDEDPCAEIDAAVDGSEMLDLVEPPFSEKRSPDYAGAFNL